MDQKWVTYSLTIWGSIVMFLSAGVPAINAMLTAMGHPTWVIDPSWIAALDSSVKAIVGGVGTLVGLWMIWHGRFQANTNLTMLPPKK